MTNAEMIRYQILLGEDYLSYEEERELTLLSTLFRQYGG